MTSGSQRSTAARGLAFTFVAIALAASLAACTAEANPVASPTVESPTTPPVSETPVPPSAFDIDCDSVMGLIEAAPGFERIELTRRDRQVVWPHDEAVLQAGGLACEWSNGTAYASVRALSQAAADYEEARAAASAAPATRGVPDWEPHTDAAMGDAAIVSCNSYGNGRGTCAWSVLSDGAWVVVRMENMSAADLDIPPETGGPLPATRPLEDGETARAVEQVVAAIANAPRSEPTPPASARRPGERCTERLTVPKVAAAFGIDEAGVGAILSRSPAEMSEHVASTAGYALPYYAASRVGWERCSVLISQQTLVELELAFGAAEFFDIDRTYGAGGVTKSSGEDGAVFGLTVFDGVDVRAIHVSGNVEYRESVVEEAITALMR